MSVGFTRDKVGLGGLTVTLGVALSVWGVLSGCGDSRTRPMAMTPDADIDAASNPDGSAWDAAPPDAAPGACEVPVDISGPGVYEGDTSTFASDHTAGCSAGSAEAPDVAYRLDVGEVPVDVVIDGTVDESVETPFDLVLSAVGDCMDEPESQLGCMDRGLGEHLELLDVTGQMTLIVDGTAQYGNAPSGTYALAVRTREILAPGSACVRDNTAARCTSGTRCSGSLCTEDSPELACADAIDITSAVDLGGLSGPGSYEVEAATYPYAADFYQGGCVFDPRVGAGEDIYRFTLTEAISLMATTDFAETSYDTALYLTRGACDADQIACHDDVDPKAVNLRSTLEVPRLEPGTYYLYVDGSSPPGTGRYRLRVTAAAPSLQRQAE